MKATLNIPSSVVLIEAALEGLVQANVVLIESGKVPPSPLDAGVRYKRESSGLEEWDNAYTVMKRGWGDCEDLNGWECAFINLTEDEWAVCALIQTGAKLFHCVVRMSDGSYRDVCPALGMKVPGTSLAGLPHFDTRAENIIGAGYKPKRSARTDNRTQAQRTYDRNSKKVAREGKTMQYARPADAYKPRGSGAPRTKAEAYVPKSSRADRQPTPETQTPEGEIIDAVTPTSASAPQATQAVPMQSYADDVAQDVQSLSMPMEDPEEFDELLDEGTDEDEETDEELAS